MKKYLLLICLLSSAVTFAQSGAVIVGHINDAVTHKPIEYATVTVADMVTKKVINGALTDSAGAYVVDGVSAGKYTVTIDFIGYTKLVSDSVTIAAGKTKTVLADIFLSPSGKTLQGVTVVASGPVIENKVDKIVYNAANDITSQGSMAIDMLKKVPQVNVDIDGNVELQGNSNIRFLINGKPSSVFGNSITDALSAIPASQIKSIEVITSPGAKYDAQGTGGIINIVLKDNKMQGINGSINLSGGTRLQNTSANINYRHNNIGVNAFFSGNAQLVSRTPSTQDRASSDSAASVMNHTPITNHLLQNGYNDFQRNGYQSGVGLDWNITKNDNINASVSYNHFANTGEGITQVQQDTLGNVVSPINSSRYSYNHFQTNSLDWSVGYKKNFKKEGRELDVLYSASYGSPFTHYLQTSTYKDSTYPFTGSASNDPGTDNENDISVDYTEPLKKKIVIETGVKATLLAITSAAAVTDLQPATTAYIPDAGQSYHLNYNMQVYAGYLSASFPLTSFINVKAGARYEYTNTKIDFPNTSIPAYSTLVPSLILSHDLGKGQFIKLSYTRRLERPDYRDVNPFLNLADPYNITTGNPLLKPEIGNNMELGYNRSLGKHGNIYVSLIERIDAQDHKQVTTFYPSLHVGDTVYTNVSVINVQNIGTEYNSGINVSGSYTIKDKLSLRSNVFFVHRYSAGLPPGSTGTDGNRFRINLNVSYQLPHDFITEAFGNYNAATNSIQGRTPQSLSYTIAFRKQFWHRNASIGVTATNIFNEYTKQVVTITTTDYTSYVARSLPYRSVGVSLTYKFGKLEFKKGKEDDSYMNNPPAMGGN